MEYISLIISCCAALVAMWANLHSNKRTDTKDLEERIKENTRINMKLDEIGAITKETKNEIMLIRNELNSHKEQIIKNEESVKSAHHRIDMIETRLGNIERSE